MTFKQRVRNLHHPSEFTLWLAGRPTIDRPTDRRPTDRRCEFSPLITILNIVYGTTREEHDENLERCHKRLLDRRLLLNQSKCTILSDILEFFGQVFSKHAWM